MTATQKQVKRALYNGLPNLSDRELRLMIDRELEKDSSQIDMNYIDTCFDLMEMHADGRIAVQPRRKWLKAVIVAALIAAATVSAMSVSAHLFNFNIPSEIAHAQQFARRIKTLSGIVPGSQGFKATQPYLQPTTRTTDVVSVIKGVIAAELSAIEHYNRLIKECDGVDYVTQDSPGRRRTRRSPA